ncbi:TD and POZ domain-containing protein 1 [Nephila pilipes]|uniref:TD and POZ domain-containing protein 1 n=1 Tax=Nephila pilipes TaxID=299642 RepID=A0A8X6TFH5_NEPPI|nr:TD and POZ domain-containing protein 1 [Nephila pilipes]
MIQLEHCGHQEVLLDVPNAAKKADDYLLKNFFKKSSGIKKGQILDNKGIAVFSSLNCFDNLHFQWILGKRLTPVPKCAEISISVISKENREIQGEQNETSPGHDSTLNCFFEFLESDISHVSVLEFVALCKISVNDPSGNTSVGIRSEILSDFEHLFDNKLFSDMIVCVGDRQYNVHRLVLAARSPVFKAMFQSEMLESSESKIIIKDSDDEAFGELLRYLYVGEINPLNSDLALRLLELADKYDVSELKSQVVDYLRCELTFKNVLSILTKAHLHNEAVLKAEAIEFAAANMWELMHTSEWETFRLQLDLVDCILAFMC